MLPLIDDAGYKLFDAKMLSLTDGARNKLFGKKMLPHLHYGGGAFFAEECMIISEGYFYHIKDRYFASRVSKTDFLAEKSISKSHTFEELISAESMAFKASSALLGGFGLTRSPHHKKDPHLGQ